MKITVDPHKPGEIKVRGRQRRHKPGYDEIAALAYRFYEEEGRPDGRDQEHWYKAEAVMIHDDQKSEH